MKALCLRAPLVIRMRPSDSTIYQSALPKLASDNRALLHLVKSAGDALPSWMATKRFAQPLDAIAVVVSQRVWD